MNKKILGLLVAAGGVVATVAGSFALYSKVAEDKNIGIGVVTSSGKDVTYSVTSVVAPQKALSPEITSDSFSFTIGATYNESGDSYYHAQDIVTGRLTVTLSGSSTLIDNLTMSGTVTGYTANTLGSNMYGTKVSATKGTASEGKNTLTYTNLVAVHTTGQKVDFDLGFTSSISQADYLSIAEETYNINISWTEDESFEHAYLVGDFNGWKMYQNGLQMQPDIDKNYSLNEWGWVIKYKLESKSDLKGVVKSGNNDVWAGQNQSFSAGEHTFRWNGLSTGDIYEVV